MNQKKVMPTTYFLIYLVIAVILSLLFPVAAIMPAPFTYLGVPLIIFGVILEIWADTLFKKKKTTIKPFEKSSVLITEGPFRLSRNPMYLGFVLILLGIAILLGNLMVIFAPIALFITLEILFIPYEENFLEEEFREKYLEYKKQVRKWL